MLIYVKAMPAIIFKCTAIGSGYSVGPVDAISLRFILGSLLGVARSGHRALLGNIGRRALPSNSCTHVMFVFRVPKL